tara:strand:+ start:192 stop:371 length:180 start_codon:yes stop_codon:yes gene_type:complete
MYNAIEELKESIEMAQKASHKKLIIKLEKILFYLEGYTYGLSESMNQLADMRGFLSEQN